MNLDWIQTTKVATLSPNTKENAISARQLRISLRRSPVSRKPQQFAELNSGIPWLLHSGIQEEPDTHPGKYNLVRKRNLPMRCWMTRWGWSHLSQNTNLSGHTFQRQRHPNACFTNVTVYSQTQIQRLCAALRWLPKVEKTMTRDSSAVASLKYNNFQFKYNLNRHLVRCRHIWASSTPSMSSSLTFTTDPVAGGSCITSHIYIPYSNVMTPSHTKSFKVSYNKLHFF